VRCFIARIPACSGWGSGWGSGWDSGWGSGCGVPGGVPGVPGGVPWVPGVPGGVPAFTDTPLRGQTTWTIYSLLIKGLISTVFM
jgi:hypothetical protein